MLVATNDPAVGEAVLSTKYEVLRTYRIVGTEDMSV